MDIYAAALGLLLAADLAWITGNKDMYGALVSKIQGTPLTVRMEAAIVAYAAIAIGVAMIGLPLAERGWQYPYLFGFVLYATFNATNWSMFVNYDPTIALIDTMWGTLLIGSVCNAARALATK